LESTTPLGPYYEYPGCSGPIVNAEKETRQ
jgi:hypothetical protein